MTSLSKFISLFGKKSYSGPTDVKELDISQFSIEVVCSKLEEESDGHIVRAR